MASYLGGNAFVAALPVKNPIPALSVRRYNTCAVDYAQKGRAGWGGYVFIYRANPFNTETIKVSMGAPV